MDCRKTAVHLGVFSKMYSVQSQSGIGLVRLESSSSFIIATGIKREKCIIKLSLEGGPKPPNDKKLQDNKV